MYKTILISIMAFLIIVFLILQIILSWKIMIKILRDKSTAIQNEVNTKLQKSDNVLNRFFNLSQHAKNDNFMHLYTNLSSLNLQMQNLKNQLKNSIISLKLATKKLKLLNLFSINKTIKKQHKEFNSLYLDFANKSNDLSKQLNTIDESWSKILDITTLLREYLNKNAINIKKLGPLTIQKINNLSNQLTEINDQKLDTDLDLIDDKIVSLEKKVLDLVLETDQVIDLEWMLFNNLPELLNKNPIENKNLIKSFESEILDYQKHDFNNLKKLALDTYHILYSSFKEIKTRKQVISFINNQKSKFLTLFSLISSYIHNDNHFSNNTDLMNIYQNYQNNYKNMMNTKDVPISKIIQNIEYFLTNTLLIIQFFNNFKNEQFFKKFIFSDFPKYFLQTHKIYFQLLENKSDFFNPRDFYHFDELDNLYKIYLDKLNENNIEINKFTYNSAKEILKNYSDKINYLINLYTKNKTYQQMCDFLIDKLKNINSDTIKINYQNAIYLYDSKDFLQAYEILDQINRNKKDKN
ncbi:hypothetical protein V2E24_00770 [Mycoplasmopsis ciconiae]|uniref:Uncharacterized protein n=1 Tax=Mycoplasmopsis ciconiae TaxID=561067 RepID=A0ABU7MKQ6_9BACT|nr:hypothetical protein [Mycoplasmopsis ciconiae]